MGFFSLLFVSFFINLRGSKPSLLFPPQLCEAIIVFLSVHHFHHLLI